MLPNRTHTLIIGASVSGLACAASLQKQNIEYLIIERQSQVAVPWRNHYQRLHLHTNKRISNLPYKRFDKDIPRYPSRQQVVDYLEKYQQEFNIQPLFNTEAISIKRKDSIWITQTNNRTINSKYVVMANGAYGKPKPINFVGIESFPGTILHSHQYKTGKKFEGKKVLVVGFGNSACEIAIDLYEQGAKPAMSVRSPVNVIPRDVLGIPILELSLLFNRLPARLVDMINQPIVRLSVGDITKLGLEKLSYGPLEQIRKHGTIPLLDIGTVQHIRDEHIKIYGEIDFIKGNTIHFKDGRQESFDAIVAGIGYYRDFSSIVEVEQERLDDLSACVDKQKFFGKDGLYFCGYWISPTGQIREIGRDAKKIARRIAEEDRRPRPNDR